MKKYRLSSFVVNKLLSEEEIGAYALGRIIKGVFELKYAGRSDNCLKNRLIDHVRAQKYTHFVLWKTSTIYAAFQMECELFHGPYLLDNKMHPDAPRHLPYSCPFCLVHDNFKMISTEVSK